MRSTSIACFSGGALATLATTGALAQAPEPSVSIPVASVEIVRILKGKICTTEGGAKFTFTSDGHYAYAGLGRTHSGHYWLGHGAATVRLDNGLERDFKISRRSGMLYMEQTAVRCE